MHGSFKLNPVVNITHMLSRPLHSAAINRATAQNMSKRLHVPHECSNLSCCVYSKPSLRAAAAPLALAKILLLLLVFSDYLHPPIARQRTVPVFSKTSICPYHAQVPVHEAKAQLVHCCVPVTVIRDFEFR